jgi:hypothetical protein
MQRIPVVDSADVERLCRRDFSTTEADEALLALRVAGFLTDSGKHARVSAAVLKLASGDLARLYSMIDAAERDWRDVIAWAEYARYRAAPIGRNRDEEEEADWREYQDWFFR